MYYKAFTWASAASGSKPFTFRKSMPSAIWALVLVSQESISSCSLSAEHSTVSTFLVTSSSPKSCLTVFPLSWATWAGLLSLASALTVALALFSKESLPSCLLSTFSTPASSRTVLVAPPAMTPVPSPAGLRMTDAEVAEPTVVWGMESFFATGNSTMSRRASATALVVAGMTSLPFPTPTAIFPFLFPTATMARKLRIFPPLTTFVTLLTSMSLSSSPRDFTLFLMISACFS
mmetsp:Transcript_8897/g.30568  ORF Transcript_8897/g.30568 Transcript_8897/m.30568 type:complete len:233 (+) Transcript_8897:38-736(+)